MKSTKAQLLVTLLAIAVAVVAIHNYTPHNRIVAPEGYWFMLPVYCDSLALAHFAKSADIFVDDNGGVYAPGAIMPTPMAAVPSHATELRIASDGKISCRGPADPDWVTVGNIVCCKFDLLPEALAIYISEQNGITMAVGSGDKDSWHRWGDRNFALLINDRFGTDRVPALTVEPGKDGVPELREMVLDLKKIRRPAWSWP